jgi:PAS domain S-box-containing protein
MKNASQLLTLRAEAEDRLYHAPVTEPVAFSTEELLHEFQIYQIELEMQNEELQRTQVLLQASRDRYLDLFDNAPVGYLTLTDKGLITEINFTAADLFGITRKDLLSRHFATLVAANDSDRWYLFFRKIIMRNQRLNIDLWLKSGNDSKVPVQLDCICVNSMLRITLIDISEIRKTDVAAAAAACQAAALVNCIPLAVVKKDATDRLEKIASQLPGMIYQFQLHTDGRYCIPYVSEGIREVFRLSPQEACEDSSKVFNLFHPDDHEGLWASIHKSAQDLRLWKHEFRIKFTDGTIHWLQGSSLPQREVDGSTIWHGFVCDITERKQMENDLRESRFILNYALDISGDGVWDWNIRKNEVVYASCWRVILGYDEGDILPNHSEWLSRIHPDDYLYTVKALKAHLEGISGKYIVEYRLRCKEGSYKWILSRGMVIAYDKNGAPLRMIGTHTDISRVKHKEQQSKDHLAQLAHVTRLGLMGEMASGMAHEVNQPLCAIATYAQAGLNLIHKENPDLVKLTEIVGKTQQQALRAGKIIHRMKSFCKSKIGARLIVDINAIVDNSVELCRAELFQNNVKLIVELEDKLPTVHIDQLQIEQVLINLIRNSIDAFKGKDEKEQRELTIQSYSLSDKSISVCVHDNGCGFDETQQQNIMTPFYTTKTEGMGMGLAISRSLIEAHEGTLLFNSIPGKGTTFYFTLPIRP